MKRVYSAPEAEIEKFVLPANALITTSEGGLNDGGESGTIGDDDDF